MPTRFCVYILLWTGLFAGSLDTLYLSQIPTGARVKESGQRLVHLSPGFTLITDQNPGEDSITVILIHGYGTRGYEWIEPIHRFANQFGSILFYRYDWNLCPDSVATIFQRQFANLPMAIRHRPMVFIAHSYGGLVTVNILSRFPYTDKIKAHIVASPLAGYSRLTGTCTDYDPLTVLDKTFDKPNVEIIQWRTNPRQDGAFKDMKVDPQVVPPGKNMRVIQLPDTMDGHRLGHNWSLTWMARHFRIY